MQARTELEKIKELTNSPHLYQGKNPERKLSAEFLRLVAANSNDLQVILGAYTFIGETIGKTYNNIQPTKQKGWIYSTGSELYTNVDNTLKEFNAANNDDRLINLFRFYQYIQKMPVVKVETTFNLSKAQLLLDLEDRMIRVRKRDNKRLAILTNSLPNLANLQKKLKVLIPEYQEGKKKEKSQKWGGFFSGPNPKRVCLLEFNGFFIESWEAYESKKKAEYKNLSDEERVKKQDADSSKACLIHYGLVLFILMRIKHEYAYLSPGGILYTLCKAFLNRSLDQVTAIEKAAWLKELSIYLHEIKQDKDYQPIFDKWQKAFDLDKFTLRIDEYLVDAEKEARTTKTARYLTAGTSYAAQYGISFGLTHASSKYALSMMGGLMVGGATGPFGTIIYTAAGTLLMSRLGGFIKDNLIPPAVGYMYATILERIGNGVATITVGAASQTYESLINNKNLKPEDRQFIHAWIDTLLHAPDTIVSAQEKAQIRYVIGDEQKLEATIPVARFK